MTGNVVTLSHLRGADDEGDRQLVSRRAAEWIALGACEDFAVMAGSTATCAGSFDCDIIGGYLGVNPGTSVTGNFVGDITSTADGAGCAVDGLAAWEAGTAMTTGDPMLAEMGAVTFKAGVYSHESSINIASDKPKVYLDAEGDRNAVFIFNVGSTLTTSAESEIVLINNARAETVFWVLGTALTMGADSILVGNVLAGSSITMGTNAKIIGRAIAQVAITCETACTIDVAVDVAVEVGFSLLTDAYPSEITVTLTDEKTGEQLWPSTPSFGFPDQHTVYVRTLSVARNGCYTVQIDDSYGDGLVCAGDGLSCYYACNTGQIDDSVDCAASHNGLGEFNVTYDGSVVATATGDFGSSWSYTLGGGCQQMP